jgi:protein TonB
MQPCDDTPQIHQQAGGKSCSWVVLGCFLTSVAAMGCRTTAREESAELVITDSTGSAQTSGVARAPGVDAAKLGSAPVASPLAPLPAAGTALGRRIASGSDPAYPELSRKLREEGSVDLAIDVANDGRLRGARIVDGSGHARLDEAALAAVRGWTFKPRTGDEPNMVYRQRFVFRLKSAQH